MKLVKFIGKEVRGYMNFDISFNDGVTFLIGINGAGKTTVLKLISGLMSASYEKLTTIKFSMIELHCINEERKIIYKCKQKDGIIHLEYINDDKTQLDKFRFVSDKMGFIDSDLSERFLGEFEASNIVSAIRDSNSAFFLGLERQSTDKYLRKFDNVYNSVKYRRNYDFVSSEKSSMDIALRQIEKMLHDKIRNFASKQSELNKDFQKQILKESLKITRNIYFPKDIDKELSRLEERQNKLNQSISQSILPEMVTEFAKLIDELKEGLKKIKTLSNSENKKNNDSTNDDKMKALSLWIVNSSKIEYIDNFIKLSDTYYQRIQESKSAINRFTESVNLFFEEGNKKIKVDEGGDLSVMINEKKTNTMYELSSGEKQLILMLAHVAFHKEQGISILAIDEPELSLHISWQELFVDALLKASPDTQYLFATHAPSIIAKNERRDWCVDISK